MTVGPHYLYDLPVYRVSYDKYNTAMDERLQRQLDGMRRFPDYEPPSHVLAGISQLQYEKFGPWRFNEIIGYVRLYILGSQIRGEYFSAEKKRNDLGRSKVFVFRSLKLAPEAEFRRIGKPFTNGKVWAAIQEYVSRCRSELRKGRVIDDSMLSTIGPFVDWIAVLEDLKTRGREK